MLAMWTGVSCSTSSCQRCQPGAATVWAAVAVERLGTDRARHANIIVRTYDSALVSADETPRLGALTPMSGHRSRLFQCASESNCQFG